MYCPVPARLLSHSHGYYAGACQELGLDNPSTGWLVPYRSAPGHPRRFEAVVKLLLTDLSGSVFSNWVPFFVDTGSDVTILPRHLLPDGAFSGAPVGSDYIAGLVGPNAVLGYYYAASMTFWAPRSRYRPIHIAHFEPLVTYEWGQPFGALGLDVLRKIITVFDSNHVAFWPLLDSGEVPIPGS